LRDIKTATSLQQQTLNKALKVLETRKLVKTVKSVQQKTKKLYMAFELEPTREISGGPWYTDQEFDHGYVDAVKKTVLKFITTKKTATLDEIHGAIATSGISEIALAVDDVRLVVESLVADGLVEMTHATWFDDDDDDDDDPDYEPSASKRARTLATSSSGAARKKQKRYKIAKRIPTVNYLTEVPCGTCPFRDRCEPGGVYAPETCVYMEQWLALPDAEVPDEDLEEDDEDMSDTQHRPAAPSGSGGLPTVRPLEGSVGDLLEW